MRVLVTGAGGFAGQHLIKALVRHNHQVLAGVHRTPVIFDERVRACSFNILDEEAMRRTIEEFKPDGIIHLAAQTFVLRAWEAPEETFYHNVIGTIRLLEAVAQASPHAKVITVGSSEEYGTTGQLGIPLSEESPCCPQNPYAVSKYAVGQIGQQLARRHSLRVVHVRPFNHYGPGQQTGFVISDFISQLVAIEAGNQEPIMNVGDLNVWRDFTYVEDIVNAYMMLLEHENVDHGIYNVCSGVPRKIEEILSTLIAKANSPTDIQIRSNQRRPSNILKFVGCAEKLREAVGWEIETSFEEGLGRTVQWWRSQLRGGDE